MGLKCLLGRAQFPLSYGLDIWVKLNGVNGEWASVNKVELGWTSFGYKKK